MTEDCVDILSMTPDEQRVYITSSLRNAVQHKGFLYHPYLSGLCMGNCPNCKDHTKDQKHLRKAKKAEFRKTVETELTAPEYEPDV
jgi:hypothetical protein